MKHLILVSTILFFSVHPAFPIHLPDPEPEKIDIMVFGIQIDSSGTHLVTMAGYPWLE